MSFRGFIWDHPDLPDWQYAVANGDTLRGFREWLEYEHGADMPWTRTDE